jgi:DNA polymerase III sliding clamp (beta) subunit (PCNA family)
MKITKKQLQYISRALIGVSSDATRYALNYVRIESINDGNTIKLVSCDGHQIVTTNMDAESLKFTAPLYINSCELKAIKGILKECKKYPDSHEFDLLDQGSFFKISFGSYNVVIDTGLDYPDYNQVIPSNDGYDYEVCLDAAILLKMVESMTDGKNTGVSLRFKGAGKPILVTLDRECSSHGVLMPRRSSVNQWGPVQTPDYKTA